MNSFNMTDRFKTNPELTPLNYLIGRWLAELIDHKWGKGTFTVSAQGGKLTSYRKSIEVTGQLKSNLTEPQK